MKNARFQGMSWAVVAAMSVLITACGSSSGAAPGEGAGSAGGQASVLEKQFPVKDNGAFDSAGINQSFICIDDDDQTYFPLDFSPDGIITQPQTGETWTYRVKDNRLEVDLPTGFGVPLTYRHGYHSMAGKLVIGFVGAITGPASAVTLACIASNHPYSDAVPETTTITCQSESVSDNGTNFNSSTTNRFTLEPGHYAQRYFSSQSHESTFDASGSFSISTYDKFYQHGTYLYDAQSGEFVMGFMEVNFETPSVDLLVFHGETDGNNISLSLADQNRGCHF